MAWRIPHWQAVASKIRMIIGHERRRAIPGVYDDGGTVNTRCLKEAIGDAPIHVERRGESLVSADRDRYFLAQPVVSLVVQGSERLFKKHDLLPRSLIDTLQTSDDITNCSPGLSEALHAVNADPDLDFTRLFKRFCRAIHFVTSNSHLKQGQP